ncbi:hypothetical protein ABZ553_25215 [Streptomyces sparsogenes]|uniref:hypothetical protein n=1 Tax=Streptomyces sparsogenes TaxID=67365 RepID=UPI0033FDCC98
MDMTLAVSVNDGLFCVSDGESVNVDTTRWSNGLIAPMDHGAWVLTGIHTGRVAVRTQALDHAPPLEASSWEEIVEASVYSPNGAMFVDPGYVTEELPYLTAEGPGWYRLRVHASGRSHNPDGTDDEPVEQYLLTAWPQEWIEQAVLRSSSRIEDALAAHTSEPHGKPITPTDQGRVSAERARLLRHLGRN